MREVYRRLFWSYDGGPFIFVPQRSFFTQMPFSYGHYGSRLGRTGNGFFGIHQSQKACDGVFRRIGFVCFLWLVGAPVMEHGKKMFCIPENRVIIYKRIRKYMEY